MTTAILFSNYLLDMMSARRMTFDELLFELGDVHELSARAWCDGCDLPNVADLPKIAVALRVDLLTLATGWMIEQLPELEATFREMVLRPLGSRFPASSDLTLRAPAAVKTAICEDMSVGDPHDVERKLKPAERIEARSGAVRKRPVRRVS